MTERRWGLTKADRGRHREGGFSTPWDAPFIPRYPFEFRNAEILTVFYRTDPAAAAFLAPPPVEASGDVVAVHIYKMNDTDWIGPYHECNVMFGARLGQRSGAYSPYLFLHSDGGVAHGREMHGQPKKYANPSLDFRGDLIVGGVERNGIDILTVTTPYKQRRADPADMRRHFDFGTNLNLKVIDHIDGRPAIRQITSRKLTDVRVHECWVGPCTVELRPNAQAPVFRLPVLEPLEAYLLAGRLHAGERRDHSRLPGNEMSKRRVVVTDYTFPTLTRERAAAANANAEFQSFQCRTADEVTEAVRGADVAVVQFAPLTAKAVEGLAEGAAVIRYGIGFDNLDIEAANRHGVPAGYVPDYCIDEVADHTVALILALLRKIVPLDASVRASQWAAVAVAKPLASYRETTIGFLGLGQIGRAVLDRLRPSGFRFLVADPALDEPTAAKLGVERIEAERLVERADVLSLHVPATPLTTKFINAERLRRMKPNAFIVNTARGALIDEPALADALKAGTIAGAALDVFQTEPLPLDLPLREAPNLILTPHAAWYSSAAIEQLQHLVAVDIEAHLAGRPLRKPVPGSLAK